MNYGEFTTELRAVLKRGSAFDDRLDGLARRAARFIEQNWTLQYMRRRFTLISVPADSVVDLPPNVPIKAIEYLRFDGLDGSRYEMTKGELSDTNIDWVQHDRYSAWPTNRALMPTHYYLDGMVALVFNRPFSEELGGQGLMAQFSDFPKAPNQTHWLLQNAEGLMLRQSVLEFMTEERDDRGFAATKMKRDEDIQVLLNSDYQARFVGQDLSWAG